MRINFKEVYVMFQHVYVVKRNSYKLGFDNAVENYNIESVSRYSTLERAIDFIKSMKEMCLASGAELWNDEIDKCNFIQLYDPEENTVHEYYIRVVDLME